MRALFLFVFMELGKCSPLRCTRPFNNTADAGDRGYACWAIGNAGEPGSDIKENLDFS
jgi:hypothetical protein